MHAAAGHLDDPRAGALIADVASRPRSSFASPIRPGRQRALMPPVRYLILGLLVFGVNLLPAFGPPTWSLLVFARLRWHFDPVLLVGLGALASSAGRLLLGLGFRKLRFHFPARYRANLENLEARLVERRGRTVALAALFVLSPLPSAQL